MHAYLLIRAIDFAVMVFYILLFTRVIFSWLNIRRPHNILIQIHRIAYTVTEPLLRPIRNILMKYQGDVPVDLSPVVLYLLIAFARRLLFRAIF